jgi:hypothetical protein
MHAASENKEVTKIWCPLVEGFRYVTVCETCRKKKKCQPYKDYLEPKLI